MDGDQLAKDIMDDSLDILADIKLDGPSESESYGQVKEPETSTGNEHKSIDGSSETTLLEIPDPAFHPACDPPYCSSCSMSNNNSYFSLSCRECSKLFETASIAQVFAIIRQWSQSIQSNLILYIEKVIVWLVNSPTLLGKLIIELNFLDTGCLLK